MFWSGEQSKENKNRFNPIISIENPGGAVERIPFQESIGDRRVPVLDHFIESITHGRQPEPSVWDNLRMLRAIFGCIESLTADMKSFLSLKDLGEAVAGVGHECKIIAEIAHHRPR